MATFHIDRDSTIAYTIALANNTYIVDPDVTFTVEMNPIVITENGANTDLQVLGQLIGLANSAAIVSAGANVDIEIGATGLATGSSGIYFRGANTALTNHGLIMGTSYYGVDVVSQTSSITNTGQISGLQFGIIVGQATERQAYSIDNDGVIQGDVGISTSAVNGDIILGEHSRVIGNSIGIQAFTQLGGTTDVTNYGFISTNQTIAYRGWTGVDTFTNYGFVKGSIQLEAGNDVFVDRGGRVTGIVLGGMGDDTFTVASKKTLIVELDNQGMDTIRSSVSYDLYGHGAIENLILTGRANISAYGEEDDNTIRGNSGSNKIDGGEGTDILSGGSGRDTFIFSADGRTDTITDFANGEDKLWIRDYVGYDSFEDLAILQAGDDVQIAFQQGGLTELIVIENARVRQFDAGDFIFDTPV